MASGRGEAVTEAVTRAIKIAENFIFDLINDSREYVFKLGSQWMKCNSVIMKFIVLGDLQSFLYPTIIISFSHGKCFFCLISTAKYLTSNLRLANSHCPSEGFLLTVNPKRNKLNVGKK